MSEPFGIIDLQQDKDAVEQHLELVRLITDYLELLKFEFDPPPPRSPLLHRSNAQECVDFIPVLPPPILQRQDVTMYSKMICDFTLDLQAHLLKHHVYFKIGLN